MKKLSLAIFTILLLSIEGQLFAQNVGINSTGASGDGSAVLDLNSSPENDKGFLIPRLTTAQRDGITSPAEGLQIYNLDCHNINYYNGSVWLPLNSIETMGPDAPGSITGNSTPNINASGETYSIAAVNGATAYNWTVPTGSVITAGQGTVAITVTFGTTAGDVCVTSHNACGISDATCKTVTLFNTCFDGVTAIVTVTGAGGAVWMDRNLGATQVATSSSDANAYGDLYQWGRCPDGHESRISGTTPTLATTAVPNLGNTWDGSFITISVSPHDWLSTQDGSLWQGINGTNNPCPGGFRIPTETEWETERTAWGSNNGAGAFASPLKLPLSGSRTTAGVVNSNGSGVGYWSSIISGIHTRYIGINNTDAGMSTNGRAAGLGVRCIQD